MDNVVLTTLTVAKIHGGARRQTRRTVMLQAAIRKAARHLPRSLETRWLVLHHLKLQLK